MNRMINNDKRNQPSALFSIQSNDCRVHMKRIVVSTCVEDDSYYQGPFWLIADSYQSIVDGQFTLIGQQYMSDYDGNYLYEDVELSKHAKTHEYAWMTNYATEYPPHSDYTYYPRGRVAIYKGKAYIHINSRCNLKKVISTIKEAYHIERLDLQIDENDVYQGSHYTFKLP